MLIQPSYNINFDQHISNDSLVGRVYLNAENSNSSDI